MSKEQKNVLIRIIVSFILLICIGLFLPESAETSENMSGPGRTAELLLYLIPYLIIGWDILREAIEGLKSREPFDENFLMAVASLGAFALGECAEGVAVMLFYQVGELFQSYAVEKSRRNITELMDIRPDTAFMENEDGEAVPVDPDKVPTGSVIIVKAGEKVPIDGIVISGESSLDTSALTGESVPRSVRVNDEILSGAINLSGTLKVRTTKEFGESTASKILDMVENASSRKSRSEAFITRFARVYTPVVCGLALLLASAVPAVRLILGMDALWKTWIYRALTFLVISCPCALVISIPLTFFAGIGGAGKAGVLVKGSIFMETLSKVRTVVFDKTGTVTEGVFEVVKTVPEGVSDEELLKTAAMAESMSTHPISVSIRNAYKNKISEDEAFAGGGATDIKELSGLGVTAVSEGHMIAAGNYKLMDTLGVKCEKSDEPGTKVYVSKDGRYLGLIIISDRIKETAPDAMRALRDKGIRTVMLTGDLKSAAEPVAKELGIDEFYAELLPSDKVEKLEEIMIKDSGKGKTAFAGDGINDAPVLSRADAGIAMGALGSDAAIEAADVVLMDDNPLKISKAVGISRKCMRIVYENIGFAIGVKALCLLLGSLGLVGMWVAIFADVGVMVIAVLNAIRALNVKNL